MTKCKNCGSEASYGIEGQKATHCSKHALDGMVDVRHPRCAEPARSGQGWRHRPPSPPF